MEVYKRFVLCAVLVSIPFDVAYSACSIPFKPTVKTPVFILSDGNEHTLFKPQANGGLTTVVQTELTLACTGSNNAVDTLNVVAITLQCQNDAWVLNGNTITDLLVYQCTRTPQSTVRSTGDKCANDSADILSVGFDGGNGRFGEVYRVCYDAVDKSGIYTHHIINGAVGKTATTSDRNFRTDETFLHPSAKYNVKATQKATLDQLLGATQQYVDTGATYFFAVGHYAPVADFEYEYEQVATNYLINAAPQYQGFNGVNWLVVEDRTRKKAWTLASDVLVYTGSLDLLELPSQSNGNVPIYLDTTPSGVAVKVPKYFFKVVQHDDEAIAFVGLNNIVPPEIAPNLASFCTNLCASETRFDDAKKGKVICCDLNDFMQNPMVQAVLPPLSATNLMDGFY